VKKLHVSAENRRNDGEETRKDGINMARQKGGLERVMCDHPVPAS
jgi:hypothetical protein